MNAIEQRESMLARGIDKWTIVKWPEQSGLVVHIKFIGTWETPLQCNLKPSAELVPKKWLST